MSAAAERPHDRDSQHHSVLPEENIWLLKGLLKLLSIFSAAVLLIPGKTAALTPE